jgi:pyruvate formate lyase activating enzyme
VTDDYSAKEWDCQTLLNLVCEDKPFYKKDGGVTCSGGECMLQADFLAEFLKGCKENGLHTCIDTAGNVPFDSFLKVLPYTDLFLYDVKCITPSLHKAYTGTDNSQILCNLQKLSARGANIIVRVPLIPEFNGNENELSKIRSFLDTISTVSVELLPYHTLGEGKYRKLNLTCEKFTVPSDEDNIRYKKILEAKL